MTFEKLLTLLIPGAALFYIAHVSLPLNLELIYNQKKDGILVYSFIR